MESQVQVLSFQLTNILSRQIFEYQIGKNTVTMLYDSGAQIPVWCSGKRVFLKTFPDAKLLDLKCKVTGFGKEPEEGDVYEIPLFELSDDTVSFQIKNLLVVELPKLYTGFNMIISETMLSKTDTTTIRRNGRILQISFDNLSRPFECTGKVFENTLKGLAVWSD